MRAITFFDDKIERVSPQNWVVAAMAELHGRAPLGIVCDRRQRIHEVVAERFAEARILLFDRDLFYAQDEAELERIRVFLVERPQLVWHVSHFERGASTTAILHRLVEESPDTALLTKTGTVRAEFTAANYFPDHGSRVRRIFAVSERTGGEIESQCDVPRARISVNYMGADRALFRPEAIADPGVNRARFGLDGAQVALGLVGSLHERKNLHQTLDVIAPIAMDHAELAVVIAGQGPLEAELRQHVHELGLSARTRFLGHFTDVVALMGALDLMVLFSRREGAVPRVLLEAMAMGTIVIAADLGAISEVVQDDRTGMLVAAHDVAGLDRALRDVLRSEERRARLRRGGFEVAERLDRVASIRAFGDEVLALASGR